MASPSFFISCLLFRTKKSPLETESRGRPSWHKGAVMFPIRACTPPALTKSNGGFKVLTLRKIAMRADRGAARGKIADGAAVLSGCLRTTPRSFGRVGAPVWL